MKKTLVVSFDTYSWVKYVSGLMLSSKEEIFELMIVSKDSTIPERAKFLCEGAIEIQRNYDLSNINKYISINKISKLDFSYGDMLHDSKRFNAILGVGILMATPTKIIFQNEPMLRKTIPLLSKNIPVFAYGSGKDFVKKEVFHLQKDVIERKLSFRKLITASGDTDKDTKFFPVVEQLFYR